MIAVGIVMGCIGPALCAVHCELEMAVFGPLTIASLCVGGVDDEINDRSGALPQIRVKAKGAVLS